MLLALAHREELERGRFCYITASIPLDGRSGDYSYLTVMIDSVILKYNDGLATPEDVDTYLPLIDTVASSRIDTQNAFEIEGRLVNGPHLTIICRPS